MGDEENVRGGNEGGEDLRDKTTEEDNNERKTKKKDVGDKRNKEEKKRRNSEDSNSSSSSSRYKKGEDDQQQRDYIKSSKNKQDKEGGRFNDDDNSNGEKKKGRGVGLREDMLHSAVQFLNNPNVRGTPLGRKVAFLERKGLSSDEIKEALRRTGEPRDEDNSQEMSQAPIRPRPLPPMPSAPPPPLPAVSGWRGLAITSVTVLGIGAGLLFLAKESSDKANQTISDIKDQIGEIKESISSLNTLISQKTTQTETKPRDDEIIQLKKELDLLSSTVSQQMIHDEKTREIADLKAQISTLKASITARHTSATSPPVTSNRSTLTWSPGDNPKQIPSWQRPTLVPPTNTIAPIYSPATSLDVTQSGQTHTPYSQNYVDIVNTVSEDLPITELNKRLGIRSDINDKPVADHPITKGTKQPRSKPWEKTGNTESFISTTTTPTTSHDSSNKEEPLEESDETHQNSNDVQADEKESNPTLEDK